MEVVNPDEMATWKPLKYIMPCIGEEFMIQPILNYLRHPIVEQVYKAGYPNLAEEMCRENQIAQFLRDYFGVQRETKAPLFKLLGCNKFLLKRIEDSPKDSLHSYYGSEFLLKLAVELKFLEGKFDVSDASQELIDMLYDYLNTNRNSSINALLPNRVHNYRYRRYDIYRDPLTEEEQKFVRKMLRMNKANHEAVSLYKDVVLTYDSLHDKPDIDLFNVRNYEEIEHLHNALVDLKREQDANMRAQYDARRRAELEEDKKAFEKLQKDRIETFEDEDDEFCIKVPKTLEEITTEGIKLHHCVGGYLSRHAHGQTNILFLRRKANEDSSFYTVEINHGKVIQIHGLHNRWLGNNPEAVPFMYQYLKKHGFNFEERMLLNKGTGYCAGHEQLDSSFLTKTA